MASLLDMRRRIKSVKNTQQITKAMKMVAAAKLKRAQDRVTSSRPFAGKMSEVLGGLSAKSDRHHTAVVYNEVTERVTNWWTRQINWLMGPGQLFQNSDTRNVNPVPFIGPIYRVDR